MFTSNRREKQGWSTDYPGADINVSVRVSELTKVPVKRITDGEEQVPDAVVVRFTDGRVVDGGGLENRFAESSELTNFHLNSAGSAG